MLDTRGQEPASGLSMLAAGRLYPRLALDGLWISDLFGFAPPSPKLRGKMLDALLDIAQKPNKKDL
jgi:hypothetical protein